MTKNKSTKRTLDSIRAQLSPSNIKLVGEYSNNKTKTQFQCHLEHIWTAIPGNVFKGDGFPICANNKRRRTKDDINLQISARDIIYERETNV
jgi:hypothetical protein